MCDRLFIYLFISYTTLNKIIYLWSKQYIILIIADITHSFLKFYFHKINSSQLNHINSFYMNIWIKFLISIFYLHFSNI